MNEVAPHIKSKPERAALDYLSGHFRGADVREYLPLYPPLADVARKHGQLGIDAVHQLSYTELGGKARGRMDAIEWATTHVQKHGVAPFAPFLRRSVRGKFREGNSKALNTLIAAQGVEGFMMEKQNTKAARADIALARRRLGRDPEALYEGLSALSKAHFTGNRAHLGTIRHAIKTYPAKQIREVLRGLRLTQTG